VIELTKRADLTSFEPSGDAVEVKSVIADAPRHVALLISVANLVCLTLNAYTCITKVK